MRNDLMRVDIREHKPLRADVYSACKTLLVQARQIWGGETRSEDTRHTLDEIVVRLMVGVGDIARVARSAGRVVRPGQWVDGLG